MRHGYRTAQGDFDYEPAEDLQERDLLWSEDDMLAALDACEADGFDRAKVEGMVREIRDMYESTIESMHAQNDALFYRAATRLAEIKELAAQRDVLRQRLAKENE